MASRFRSFSKPAFSFVNASSKLKSNPFSSSVPLNSSTIRFSRVARGIGSLESMLPLHSVVSSARLTSRLGIDSVSRALSQESGLCIPR